MSRISWLTRFFGPASQSSRALTRKLQTHSPMTMELLEDRTAPAGLDALAPQITSLTPNGGAAAFAGPQHSRVVNVQVAFDQPAQLDSDAVALSLHTENVSYAGVAQPSGLGAVPTLVASPSSDFRTWTITFAGQNTDVGSVDGFASLKDGVYDFTVHAAKVHPLGAPGSNMVSDRTITFHRLYGETSAASSTTNGDTTRFYSVVNSLDNLAFRKAFNNNAAYKAYLDINGDGYISSGDNREFLARFNKGLSWSETASETVAAASTPALPVAVPVGPQVASITPNFGYATSSSPQNSKIVNIVVTFDQPVLLDDGALILSLHTNNIRYGGASLPSGLGAIPAINVVHGDDLRTWMMVFSGPNTEGATTAGLASLIDGVYDFTVDASKVHSGANLTVAMANNQAITFYRLFGDTTPASSSTVGGSTTYSAVVNSGDSLAFRTAFNNAAGYRAYLDFNGDGTITSADNLAFRTRFNKSLTWTA